MKHWPEKASACQVQEKITQGDHLRQHLGLNLTTQFFKETIDTLCGGTLAFPTCEIDLLSALNETQTVGDLCDSRLEIISTASQSSVRN